MRCYGSLNKPLTNLCLFADFFLDLLSLWGWWGADVASVVWAVLVCEIAAVLPLCAGGDDPNPLVANPSRPAANSWQALPSPGKALASKPQSVLTCCDDDASPFLRCLELLLFSLVLAKRSPDLKSLIISSINDVPKLSDSCKKNKQRMRRRWLEVEQFQICIRER